MQDLTGLWRVRDGRFVTISKVIIDGEVSYKGFVLNPKEKNSLPVVYSSCNHYLNKDLDLTVRKIGEESKGEYGGIKFTWPVEQPHH